MKKCSHNKKGQKCEVHGMEECPLEESNLKQELLKRAETKHNDAKKKKFNKFMSDVQSAKDRRSKGMRGTSGGKWGHFKKGKFTPD
tara:strand:+ start:2074 stop:2331 length:258 start_codon:yes stop_codon:yes gene_type:complete